MRCEQRWSVYIRARLTLYFQLGMSIDMVHMMTESKDARRQDAEHSKRMFEHVISNDTQILAVSINNYLPVERDLQSNQQLLETQLPQMQEAILGIQKVCYTILFDSYVDNVLLCLQRLPQLGESPERAVLTRGMLVMQRRSKVAPPPPDDFTVTSLEVIIHEHTKLGEGGFGQVFRAAWLGAMVAVKVMEKGVPPRVYHALSSSYQEDVT